MCVLCTYTFLRPSPRKFRDLLTYISRTFQDENHFPGLCRSCKFFQDFLGGIGTLVYAEGSFTDHSPYKKTLCPKTQNKLTATSALWDWSHWLTEYDMQTFYVQLKPDKYPAPSCTHGNWNWTKQINLNKTDKEHKKSKKCTSKMLIKPYAFWTNKQ